MKRPWQPSKLKRKRRHGFFARHEVPPVTLRDQPRPIACLACHACNHACHACRFSVKTLSRSQDMFLIVLRSVRFFVSQTFSESFSLCAFARIAVRGCAWGCASGGGGASSGNAKKTTERFFMKRPWQPSKLKRKRRHGFFARMASKGRTTHFESAPCARTLALDSLTSMLPKAVRAHAASSRVCASLARSPRCCHSVRAFVVAKACLIPPSTSRGASETRAEASSSASRQAARSAKRSHATVPNDACVPCCTKPFSKPSDKPARSVSQFFFCLALRFDFVEASRACRLASSQSLFQLLAHRGEVGIEASFASDQNDTARGRACRRVEKGLVQQGTQASFGTVACDRFCRPCGLP